MVKGSETWLEASDVIPMFPTLVWKIQLTNTLRDEINAKVVTTLERLKSDLPALEAGQGWQSEQTLHKREELRELVTCINSVAKSVLRFLRIGEETTFDQYGRHFGSDQYVKRPFFCPQRVHSKPQRS